MDSQKHIDLGSWVGLQKAFANVASGCSAARAQCLKQVRDSKMLDDLGLTWEEFCSLHAGLSRRQADHLIQQYERFGDAYFRLTEIAPVSPKTFQQIAAQVTPDSIEVEGQALALTPENAPKIRAAIQSLRRQILHPRAEPRPAPDVIELRIRVDALIADLAKAIAALQFASPIDGTRPALSGFVVYVIDKFRNLARQLEASA